jgi:hypothetical protein
MLVAFAKPIAAGILLVASGPQMPRFDIEQICHATADVHWDHTTMHECRREERAARDDLQHRWLRIPLRYREQCVGSALEVSPSYVELGECIETDLEIDKQKTPRSPAPQEVDIPDADD